MKMEERQRIMDCADGVKNNGTFQNSSKDFKEDSTSDIKIDENSERISDGGEQNDELKKGKQKFTFRGLSKEEKLTLVLLAAAHFSHMVGFSLMAPFFPIEAEKKGVSKTVTGFIFSIFEFIVFISAPLYGYFLTTFGASFLLSAGIFVAGVSNILFGLLSYCEPTSFVVLCFITRSVEALGISAYAVASLAIASKTFPDNISTVFSLMETGLSVGLMVGPLLGNLLYQAGGYGLPFYILGGLMLSMGLLVFFSLPQQNVTGQNRELSPWAALRSGQVWATACTISTAAFALGFIDTNLALHAKQIGIPTFDIGFVFILLPVCYAGMAPLWGWLSDSKGLRGPLIVGGNLVSAFAFLLLGPSPLLPFIPQSPWVVLVGLALIGMAVGCSIMPTMKCLLLGAHDVGFGDNLDTFGLVSGLFNSFYCLGSFLGPFFGGMMVDRLGFDIASSVDTLLFLFAMFVSLLYFGTTYLRKGMESHLQLPLRVTSDEDSIPVHYNAENSIDVTNAHTLSVLSLSMRAGMSRNIR